MCVARNWLKPCGGGYAAGRSGRRHASRASLARLPRCARVRAFLGSRRPHVRAAGRATGVPVELLMLIREATGSPAAAKRPHSRRRRCPTPTSSNSRSPRASGPVAIRRLLRDGRQPSPPRRDGVRVWHSEVMAPAVAAGKRPDDVARRGLRRSHERALGTSHHRDVPPAADEAWTANILDGVETTLARPGCTAASSTCRRCASWTSPATPG